MNPKSKDTLKGIGLALLICLALIIWHFISNELPEQWLERLDEIYVNAVIGIAGIAGVGACAFIFSNLFREIYTESIMHRANSLLDISMDEKGEFLYVAVDLYWSYEGVGHYTYRHYLFELKTGKKFVYKAKKSNREDAQAIEYFNKVLRQNFSFVLNSDKKPERKIETVKYIIQTSAFKKKFDFGFQITCFLKGINKTIWETKI